MTTKPIGLYVHIPFCKSKCKYCDFSSYEGLCDCDKIRYFDELVREILSYKREEKIPLDTIYFGGGTPSFVDECFIEGR